MGQMDLECEVCHRYRCECLQREPMTTGKIEELTECTLGRTVSDELSIKLGAENNFYEVKKLRKELQAKDALIEELANVLEKAETWMKDMEDNAEWEWGSCKDGKIREKENDWPEEILSVSKALTKARKVGK